MRATPFGDVHSLPIICAFKSGLKRGTLGGAKRHSILVCQPLVGQARYAYSVGSHHRLELYKYIIIVTWKLMDFRTRY